MTNSQRPSAARSTTRHLLCVTTLIALGTVLYSQTLRVPFVFDDTPNISDNQSVRLVRLDAVGLLRAALNSPMATRPVAYVSFALNHVFGADDVRGYHAVNTAIHIVNGVLAYTLCLVMFASGSVRSARSVSHWAALGAALLFIAHPIQTQAVTYTVQRMTSMAAMFYLLSLLFWVTGRHCVVAWRRWTFWLIATASWLFALGTKQIAITLPLVVWLYEWFFFQNIGRSWLKRSLPVAVAAVAILVLIGLVYTNLRPWAHFQAAFEDRDFSMLQRLFTQSRVVVSYFALVLFPHPWRLNLHHEFITSVSLIDPAVTAVAAAALGGLFALSMRVARRHRTVSFGVLWLFVHLVIESSIWPLEMAFEHRMYLPMFGVAVLSFHFLCRVRPRTRGVAVITVVAAVAGLSAATLARNTTWHERTRLWADVIVKSPSSYRAHINLAIAYSDCGSTDAAMRGLHRMLQTWPDSADAHYVLGNELRITGRIEEAVDHYREALRIDPDMAPAHNNLGMAHDALRQHDEAIRAFHAAVALQPDLADAQNNLGEALRRDGQFEESIEHFHRALDARPDFGEAHYNLGLALQSLDRMPDATDSFGRALQTNPHWPDARFHLAHTLASQNLFARAETQFRWVLRENPNHVSSLNELAWLLATSRDYVDPTEIDPHEAVSLAERAAQLSGHQNASILDTLAVAYAAAQRFKDAVQTSRLAIRLTIDSGREKLAGELRARLERYERQRHAGSGGFPSLRGDE